MKSVPNLIRSMDFDEEKRAALQSIAFALKVGVPVDLVDYDTILEQADSLAFKSQFEAFAGKAIEGR